MRKIVPVFMAALLLAGCAGKGVSSDSPAGETGPGRKLKSILTRAARGDYGSLSGDVLYAKVATLDMDFRSAEEWSDTQKEKFWEALTGKGALVEVLILSEQIDGRFAVVKINLLYRDGSIKTQRFEMHKSADERWILPVYRKMLKQQAD